MKRQFPKKGVALVTILVFSVILMFVGISVVALATGNTRYSMKRNNELLTRQAALAGINEMKSVATGLTDFNENGIKTRIMALLSMTDGTIKLHPGPPPNLEYTKNISETGCSYHVVIIPDLPARKVEVTSEGYLTEGSSPTNKPWRRSIAVTFAMTSAEFAAFSLNQQPGSKFSIVGSQPEHIVTPLLPPPLACGLKNGTIEAFNPGSTGNEYTIYRPIGSTITETKNPEKIKFKDASFEPPLRLPAPHPFPEVLAEEEFQRRGFNGCKGDEYNCDNGGDQTITSDYVTSVDIAGEGTNVTIGSDGTSSTLHCNSMNVAGGGNPSNPTTLIFYSGNYYFKDFIVNNGTVEIHATKGPVNIFYYKSLDLDNCSFNAGGDAHNVVVYGVTDIFGIPESKINDSKTNMLFSNYDGIADINNSFFGGSILADGFLINDSKLELIPSGPASGGSLKLISWKESQDPATK